jgi:hypothetical protein
LLSRGMTNMTVKARVHLFEKIEGISTNILNEGDTLKLWLSVNRPKLVGGNCF